MGNLRSVIQSAAVSLVIITMTGAFTVSVEGKSGVAAENKECVKYTNEQNTTEKKLPDKKEIAAKKELLFFMNPYGRPCQMQDAILKENIEEISTHATIRYIKTSEASDRSLFGKYGIRGLPSLIILDENGAELNRFSPGVQDGKIIQKALQ